VTSRRAARGDVVVTDARAIKALAHPARMTAIDELYAGRVLTSSELAELAALTPSAMSYHLRALERWGIVERAPARSDGRERPWQASGTGLTIRTDNGPPGAPASPSANATVTAISLEYVERLRSGLARWLPTSARDPWDDVSRLSNSHWDLTHDEAAQLAQDLEALLVRYRQVPGSKAGPDTRRMAVFLALYPDSPPPASDPNP
jgi:DNA-binding transcriptional ArsR family regulator